MTNDNHADDNLIDGEDDEDILQHMINIVNDSEHDSSTDKAIALNDEQMQCVPRQVRKPYWWRRRASQKGTKAQRRAQKSMGWKKLPVLPFGELYNFGELFGTDFQGEVWLEIGSGQGDVLLANAERHPHVGMIGADVYNPGIGATMVRIEGALRTKEYWEGYNEYDASKDPFAGAKEDAWRDKWSTSSDHEPSSMKYYSNVRLHLGDGMKLVKQATQRSSLDKVLMTFPDPFPSYGQQEHRLLQTHSIQQLHRALKPNGVFLLATDDPEFYEWALELFNDSTALFRKIEPCPPRASWLPVISKYEQKGWDEGRRTFLLCWEAIK